MIHKVLVFSPKCFVEFAQHEDEGIEGKWKKVLKGNSVSCVCSTCINSNDAEH